MNAADRCIARIVSRTGHPVQRLVLEMPASFRFRAGQYLTVAHPDGGIPLSIASAPRRLPLLHLHYRSTPGNPEAARMDALLDGGSTLEISGPAGSVGLEPPGAGPTLIVAGGTGIAQAFGLVDALPDRAEHGDLTVLWCADRQDDFYQQDALAGRAALVTIADPRRDEDNAALAWLRRHGGRFAAAGSQVVVCGAPAFVYAACDALHAAGVPTSRLQSDVFDYAPRPGSGSDGRSRSA